MGAAALVSLVIALLQSILSAAKVGGVAPEVIGYLEGVVDNLLKVQGSDVTYQQLEGLRVKTEW